MAGIVQALAMRAARRAPMQLANSGTITQAEGLVGDYKGAKHPTRQITILAEEDWHAALADLCLDPDELDWTVRRANVFICGLRLPRVAGAIIQLGAVRLEVTGQTYPCRRMDEAHQGLLKALAQAWRGGVTCRVLEGGDLKTGDPIEIISSPRETVRRLPG